MSTLSVGASGRSPRRTCASSGSALAIASSRSRAATNSSRLIPLVFCNCMLKPGGVAEPAHGAGHEGEHLRVAQAAERRGRALGDRVGGVLLARALVPRLQVDEALAGVLPGQPAAAPPPATRNNVRRSSSRMCQVLLDHVAHLDRASLRRAGGQAPLHRDPALVLARKEAAGQAQEQHHEQHDDQRVIARNSHLRSTTVRDVPR